MNSIINAFICSCRNKGDATSFPTTNGHNKTALSTAASDLNRQQQQHLHSSSNYSNITSGSSTLPSLSKTLHHHHVNNLGVDSSSNSQLISRTLKHHSSTQQVSTVQIWVEIPVVYIRSTDQMTNASLLTWRDARLQCVFSRFLIRNYLTSRGRLRMNEIL